MDFRARRAIMQRVLDAIAPSDSSTFAVFPSNHVPGARRSEQVCADAWEGECFQTVEVCACRFGTHLETSFYTFDATGTSATARLWVGGSNLWRYDAPSGEELTCCLDGAVDQAKAALAAVGTSVLSINPCTLVDYDRLHAAQARLSPFPVDDYVFRRCVFAHATVLVDVRVQYALGLGGTDRNDVPPEYNHHRRQNDYLLEISCDKRNAVRDNLASARKRAAHSALGVY